MRKIVLAILILLASAPVSAETIYLKSGRVITGKIIHRTPIYIRLEPRFLGDPDREFLVENVVKIVKDGENYVPAQEVLNYVSTDLKDVPPHIQQAAKQMAVSLLEQAMRNVQIPSIDAAPENVKRVAEQKATDLLAQAMTSLNETPDNVKSAAREIANSLLEETVRTTALDSTSGVPDDVKKAAQEKATALIEQAMIGSVEEAPNQVKLAAQLKARALIEDAMKEINVLEGVLEEGKSAQQEYELAAIDQRNKQLARSKITTFNREIPQDQVDSLMHEAVQRRVENSIKSQEFQAVEGTDGMVEAMTVEEKSDDSELLVTDIGEVAKVTKVDEVTEEPVIIVDDNEPQAVEEIRALSEEELKKRIASIPQPKMKELTFNEFILALTYRDFLAMGLCIILLLILLTQRSRSKKHQERDQGSEQDIQVVSSVTFQHLPDDIKRKFTSSDITLILEYEEQFRNKSDQTSGEHVIDDENLLKFIQEQIHKVGGRFATEDLKKVLETKEKTLTETGLA